MPPLKIFLNETLTLYYTFVVEVANCFSCSTGIGLTLNSVQYTNNSVVNIMDIGTDGAALICTTTFGLCCFSNDGSDWYFPNGSAVPRPATQPYYRTRTFDGSSTVDLHRNPEATTTGVFNCTIPDASGVLQSIYVGVYTATTGESCTLESNMLVVISNLYDFMLCSIKIFIQKLIMKMSDHGKPSHCSSKQNVLRANRASISGVMH